MNATLPCPWSIHQAAIIHDLIQIRLICISGYPLSSVSTCAPMTWSSLWSVVSNWWK